MKIKSVARCSFPQKCGKSEVLDLTTYNHELWIGNSFGWFWFDNPLQGIQKFLIFKGYDMVRWFHICTRYIQLPYWCQGQQCIRCSNECRSNATGTLKTLRKPRGKMRNLDRCSTATLNDSRCSWPNLWRACCEEQSQIMDYFFMIHPMKIWDGHMWHKSKKYSKTVYVSEVSLHIRFSPSGYVQKSGASKWAVFSCRKWWSPIAPLTRWSFTEEEAVKNWKAKSPAARQDLFTKPWRLISKGDSHESDLTPGYEIVTPNSQSGVMRKSRVVTATRLTVWS